MSTSIHPRAERAITEWSGWKQAWLHWHLPDNWRRRRFPSLLHRGTDFQCR
jgi:hypothetical protein